MIRQILSDETMNRKGYITLNDGVNWDEYRKNPVLMLEHEDDKQPIGRIDNIRFEDNAWYGDLVFADTEEGREKEKLYNEGFYNAVSISGLATKVKREGVVYAVQFDVWEVSLVAVPANPNAIAQRTSDKSTLSVSFNDVDDKLIEPDSLSAYQISTINKFKENMEANNKPETEVKEEALKSPESVEAAPEEPSAEHKGFMSRVLSSLSAGTARGRVFESPGGCGSSRDGEDGNRAGGAKGTRRKGRTFGTARAQNLQHSRKNTENQDDRIQICQRLSAERRRSIQVPSDSEAVRRSVEGAAPSGKRYAGRVRPGVFGPDG